MPHIPNEGNARYLADICNSTLQCGSNQWISQTVFRSVHAILVQRDPHVPDKPELVWKIYRCSSDLCKTYSVSVSENVDGSFPIFLLPISFDNCIRHLNMQEHSGSGALLNYTFVHMSACSCDTVHVFLFTFQMSQEHSHYQILNQNQIA